MFAVFHFRLILCTFPSPIRSTISYPHSVPYLKRMGARECPPRTTMCDVHGSFSTMSIFRCFLSFSLYKCSLNYVVAIVIFFRCFFLCFSLPLASYHKPIVWLVLLLLCYCFWCSIPSYDDNTFCDFRYSFYSHSFSLSVSLTNVWNNFFVVVVSFRHLTVQPSVSCLGNARNSYNAIEVNHVCVYVCFMWFKVSRQKSSVYTLL